MTTQYTRWAEFQKTPTSQRNAVLEDLRQKMHQFVISELGPILYDQRISEDELRRQVNEQLQRALAQEGAAISAAERGQLLRDVADDVLGYGPIDRLLKDATVTEVMVNGPNRVYVERAGKLEVTDVRFVDETHLRRIIDKIVSQVGRRVDESNPLCDARLPDGSTRSRSTGPSSPSGSSPPTPSGSRTSSASAL
jgi:pilus assembly protein CpaF